jgi:hypothetical protein
MGSFLYVLRLEYTPKQFCKLFFMLLSLCIPNTSARKRGCGMKHAASSVLPDGYSNTDYSQEHPKQVVIGLSSRKKSEVDFFDPYDIQRKFPDRWRAYLHAHFRSHIAVAQFFQVCEKAARKWWDGVGGPRGDKIAVAMKAHPETASVYLFPSGNKS